MALTDAQAKIINQTKKKKEKTKQKAASSNPSVKSGSLALGGSSQLSPLQLAKQDAATNTTVRNKVDNAKQSKASINTQKSVQANEEKKTAKSQIKSQLTLSESDAKLPSASQKGILDAKVAYEQAKTAGDKEGMAKAHQQAEKIRSRFGYSGGAAGTEKIEGPGLTEKDKVALNKTGQQALLSALTLGNKERAEEIRNAKGFQAVDHSQQKDGEGRTIFAQTKEEREKAGKQALAGLEAAGKGFAGSLLSVHETFNQAMRNYNQERWQGKPNGQATIVDPMLPGQRLLRESKEAAGEALEGKTGLSALLTKAGISGAQMLPGLAASFIPGVGPAVGATILGAQAAGSKMGELNEQSSQARLLSYMQGGNPRDYGEVTPQEAFTRGIISGGIEGLTERIPIKGLLKIVKGNGGANFLVNIAKQAGTEATEESASTVLNHLADLAAKDPNASLTLGELAEAAAVGAISGAGFGAGGSAINSAIGKNQQKTGQETLLKVAGIGKAESQQNEPEQTFEQPQQETPMQAETSVQERERGEANNDAAEEAFDPTNIPRDAINKRKNEPGGWGKYYQNTTEMLFDHLREVNPELSSVVDAEADSQSGPFPAINAVVAASQDVRQDKVTPAAAIRFLSDTFKNGGVAGLEALYSPNTGNLTPESLETMKKYEAMELGETTEDELRAEFEAMGAASEGFDPYTNAMNKYGTIDPGENPARMVDVPKSTDGTDKVSKFARNLLEAEVTTEPTIKRVEKMIMDQGFSYKPKKDKQSLEKAISVIEIYGIDPALAQWQEVVDGRRSAGKDDIVLAEVLYINAERNGDTELASRLAAEIAAEGTRMGQGIQALRLLKKATKEGRVYYIRKSVEYVKQELQGRMGDKAKDISISDELIRDYMDAQGKAAEDKALDAIYTNVAEQIPPTLNDRITAWRYFAMLGNPRTHIKNVIGNVLFGGVNRASNKVSSLLQRALIPEGERTRSFFAKAEAKEFAKRDFEEMKSSLGGDKYDSAYTEIQRKVQDRSLGIFSPAARFSSNAMTAEDLWAKKSQYIRSMAEIITARGWDANNLTPEQLETARTQAVKDAQKVTFQEASDLAKTLTKLEKKGPAWNLVIGGIMPFKGVPINIAKQGWRLSPAGLLDSLAFDFRRVKHGDLTATEAIDRISQGLTGTSIAAIGMFLASQGILISGEGEDERESLVNMAQGSQEYSLRIGDYTYTIDWAAPAALPMFMGAEFYNTLFSETERDEDVGALEAAFESGLRLFEPMMNMTVLSGLSDTIESASFSQGNKIAAIGTNTLENFAGQFVPTLLGQAARTFGDDTRRSTYIDRSSVVPDGVQEFGQRQANKIPGLSKKNVPYLNVWGEEDKTENVLLRAFENFISPGYIAKYEESEVADELKRLNRAGYDNVLLNTLDKYHKVDLDGDKTQERLDRNQWESWQRTQGQTAKSILTDAINSSEYQAMSDTEKADYVSTILNYAKAEGKLAAGGAADTVDSWITKTDDLESKTGIGVSALLEARSKAKAYKAGDSTQDAANYIDFVSYLANKGYSEEQMDAVSETYYEPSERAQGYADAVQSGKVSGDLMKTFLSHAVSYNEDGEGALTQKEVAMALRDMEDISNADRLAIYNAHGWKTSYYDALRKK